ncbi:hypothetical protein KY362_07650 [Candidatus Woesearchaeota archaeon]|nr:hypothetical protein [Candidatus Woesearchaeota archaeon]
MESYLTRCLERLQDTYHAGGLSRVNGTFNDTPLAAAVTDLRNHEERREFYEQFKLLRAEQVATEFAHDIESPDTADIRRGIKLETVVSRTCREKMLCAVKKVEPSYLSRWENAIRRRYPR